MLRSSSPAKPIRTSLLLPGQAANAQRPPQMAVNSVALLPHRLACAIRLPVSVDLRER